VKENQYYNVASATWGEGKLLGLTNHYFFPRLHKQEWLCI